VYCSVAASYFTEAGMVATVGTDFPGQHVAFLKEKSVDLTGLTTLQGDTFHWGARYHENMNKRDTLFTHLNVFEKFSPDIPQAYRSAPYVFLGNIDPKLQMHVLDQMAAPEVVALDTMNFWIEGTPDDLAKVLKKTMVLLVNNEEASQLTGENNLLRAARAINKMGPKIVIIKKGEHGAALIYEGDYFYAPAFPLEQVNDPTGAGDTFAGGFMGYLAKAKRINKNTLRRAMIYGSTLASFAVEDFSVERLRTLAEEEISRRFNAFHDMVVFERE
ncbi:MAG: PfkB family carbohydrate kinase, partial [bacterium]